MLIGDVLYRFKGDYSNLDKGAEKSAKALGKTGKASDSLRDQFVGLQGTTSQLGAVFSSVFATVMAGGLAMFLKTVALTSARTQVLGTTLLVVGENAGYMRKELVEQEKSLKSLGITTQVARNTLVRMIQTQMDVTKAEELANAARNLAVVSGKNTSATLQTLILGLVTLQTETLRTAGITINLETESKKWAKANNVVYGTMTMMQRRQAALNAVIEQATALDGAYVTAQEDLGKQLASFARYTEEASNMFGEFYLPALLQVVLGTRDLLKGYQALDPETRRLISTIALFATGLGVLAAAFIGVLTLGPLLLTMLGAVAAAFTPTLVVIAAVGVAITALGALWATNMWGIRDSTQGTWSIVKAEFTAGVMTINNMVGSVVLSLKFLNDVMSKPWKAGVLFYELQESLARLNSEVVASWKNVLTEAEKVAKARLSVEQRSNIELKEGSLKLTEEQLRQREVLRDYGIVIGKQLIDELKKLHGKELADFVEKQKQKFDLEQSLMKQALEIEARYVKGLYDLHVKELKQKESFEKAKLDLMLEAGEVAEKAEIERSYRLTKSLLDQELLLKEKNLKEVLVIMKKQQKPAEDIELARLKGLQEIEALRLELVKAHLKYEAALYEASSAEKERVDEEILVSLKHRHALEAAEDQKAADAYLISQSELLKRKGARELEAQGVFISTLKERLDALKEAGKTEGQEYENLYVEYVAALNQREQAYSEYQNRLLALTVQEEEKRLDILTELSNERQISQFKSQIAREAFQLHQSSLQEITEMERRVKQGQVPYEEFYAWKQAKEEETGEAIRKIQLESQRGTEEYLQLRIDQLKAAGATEIEIATEVYNIKRDCATSFAEGWKLGLEEMVLDTYTWADASSSIVQGFAQNAASAIDTTLFDLIKTGSVDIYSVIEGLGEVTLRTITQALGQMAVQWLVNAASSTAYSSTTMAGLIAEQAQVAALIATYSALAAAKTAASVVGGVPGMQGGGLVYGAPASGLLPGYGGGDKVLLMGEMGEYMMRKEMTRRYLPVLDSMQEGRFPTLKGYQEGGKVEGPSVSLPPSAEKERVINILNFTDPNEVLRVLHSKAGEDAVVNVIRNRDHSVRSILR